MKKNLLFLCLLCFIQNTIKAQVEPPSNQTPKLPEPKVELSKDPVIITGDSVFLWNNTLYLFKKSSDTSKLIISPFSLSFGYNFDFLDGIKTNELYADLRVDLPNVLQKKSKIDTTTFWDRFGVEVGAYQLRTVSRLDTVTEQFRLVDSSPIPPDSLQLLYITANSNSIRKTIRENLDVYIQPKFELINTKETRLNLLLHSEWLRSILDHSFERNTNNDTTLFVPSDWPRPYNTVNEVPSTEKSKSYEYNFYLGTGFDLRVNKTEANFYLKMICGYNGAKLLNELEDGTSQIGKTGGWFYLAKFEVLESQITGIKLGVEVRGLFSQATPSPTIDRALPGFGIYLAKQFTFQKIGDLFKP
jgi:hypothetical protein